MRKWWLGLLTLLVLRLAQPTLAHANLISADPAPNAALDAAPAQIRLRFSEPVERFGSSITLRDAEGAALATAHSDVDPADPTSLLLTPGPLPNGLYTVVWRTLSAADGHTSQGSYAFGIGIAPSGDAQTGAAAAPASAQSVIMRWVRLLGTALVIGPLTFGWLGAPRSRLTRLTWAGVALLTAGWLLQFVLQLSAAAPGSSTQIMPLLTSSRFGLLWSITGGVLLVLTAALARDWHRLALSLCLALAGTHTLFSHASGALDAPAALAAAFLHLILSALWMGGLAVLLASHTRELRAGPDGSAAILEHGQRLAQFSIVLRFAVAGLVVTGLYAGWLHVGSSDALTSTAYGQALLVKLALLAALLGLAAFNTLLTIGRLHTGSMVWIGRLRVLVCAELALGAALFAAAAFLTASQPARDVLLAFAVPPAAGQRAPYFGMATAGQEMVHLEIAPGYVGSNAFTITLYDADGQPITNASRIRLRFTNLDADLGVSELRAQSSNDGLFLAEGANLSTPGRWRVRVTIQRPGVFDTVVDFQPSVQAAPPPPQPLDQAPPLQERMLAQAVTGATLLALGAGAWWSLLRAGRRDTVWLALALYGAGTLHLLGAAFPAG
jgi:copper transport protein